MIAPEHIAGWFVAWSAGWDAGERSRPTDQELQAWADEIRENAYRAGYADGWAGRIEAHRAYALALRRHTEIGLDRARPGSAYIPRESVA